MASAKKQNDLQLIHPLAGYRVSTASQLAATFQVSKQVIRRRLGRLADAGLVNMAGTVGGSRGRPENVVALTARAYQELECGESEFASEHPQPGTEPDLRQVKHQLLINWFRIHLAQMEKSRPRLSSRHLQSRGLNPDGGSANQLGVSVASPRNTADRSSAFVPDLAFTVADQDRDQALLFFLEVDMGTESLKSVRHRSRSIQQKIVNYQMFFRSEGYKRIESDATHSINGFRVLFLTTSNSRLAALCRLTRESPPSDFVWLTDEERLFRHGASAAIWARGGRLDDPPQSILGKTLCFESPLPDRTQ